MSILKEALKRALRAASANAFVQGGLQRNIRISQELMGIGSGGDALASGEHGVFRLMSKTLNPPYCIFDVGSNQGQFLKLVLSQIKTEDFTIHCFEPGIHTFKQLDLSAVKDQRIILNNFGMSRSPGEACLYYDEAGSKLASLTRRNLSHVGISFDKSEKVRLDTIDRYCAEKEIQCIQLLKIDVEGHELDVLEGAHEMLHSKRVRIVTFEFGQCNVDSRTFFRDFWFFFKGLDMRLLRITPTGYLFPVTRYEELLEQFRVTNFVALPQE
jgi:FkbM family methyltransferase